VGTIGEARRPVLVDFDNGIVRVDATTQFFIPGDMLIGATDIYVRPYLLEKFLPVEANFEQEALRLALKAREPLPIQSRLDRLVELRKLQMSGSGGGPEDVYRIKTPARFFSLPSFDVQLDGGGQRETPRYPFRYDVRAGGDLLFSNFQGFVGSDEAGKPVTARASLERRDPDGHALGPLGLTRITVGDTYTPSLSLGARSLGGRGISFSNSPLIQQAVFGRIDLRGDLPLGFDVELYVNDVLRSGQSTPVQGRYEFRDVPLVRGINIIRIVVYGPRGERSEEVKVVNTGGGQVEKGKLLFDFGAAQQERPLIELGDNFSNAVTSPGVGDLRVAMNFLYGLTERVTLAGGLATYSPNGLEERRLVTAGIKTSLRGVATQVDVARDDKDGTALAVALAGRLSDLSVVVRHAEYRRGFVDETLSRGGNGRPLTRSSETDLDWQLKWGQFVLPVSMRVARDQYVNGDLEWNGLLRASTALGGVYLSSGLDFSRLESRTGAVTDRLSGVLSLSSFALFKWQLRASLDYNVLPDAGLRAFAVTADRSLSQNSSIRLGVGRSFTGAKETSFQVQATRRFPFADLSLQGEYSAPRNDWRIGLQLAFSFVPNPLGGGYRLARPGAAAAGNVALQAFVDRNANARFDAGEEPVPGVVVGGLSNDRQVTDEKGKALLTGLGYGSITQVRTNIDDIALSNVSGPPSVIEFTPRAGVVAVIPYPLETEGEVMLKVSVRRGEKMVGLSAVIVKAVGENGQIREGITEFDGSVLFEGLRPGSYRLDLDEKQAKRLKMRLTAPVNFVISGEGGAAPDVEASVVFDDAK
jgi:hypothetical protein